MMPKLVPRALLGLYVAGILVASYLVYAGARELCEAAGLSPFVEQWVSFIAWFGALMLMGAGLRLIVDKRS